MSIINRNSLKGEFQTGNSVTEEKFANLIDSAYNRAEDSLLLGPLGVTGKWGLLGPTGGTTIGMYLINSGPTGPTSIGSTGQVFVGASGSDANLFIHNGSQWFKFTGLSDF
jgi:hypothetical protein